MQALHTDVETKGPVVSVILCCGPGSAISLWIRGSITLSL